MYTSRMNSGLLRAARLAQRLRQKDVAARAGLGQADISRIEAGWLPPADILQRVCGALGVNTAVVVETAVRGTESD